jgi:hypothetical protein
VKALGIVTTDRAEKGGILGGRYSVPDHLSTELDGNGDDGSNQCRIALALTHPLDQRLVDFEYIERKTPEVGKGTVACPEPVHPELDARIPQ